jgi:drug/metabolite transporter (DMT)-like permease
MTRGSMGRGILYGTGAAVTFGASIPLSKQWLDAGVEPLVLAALLYLGSGLGPALQLLLRRGKGSGRPLRAHDLRWLVPATFCGGMVAPVLLALGVARIPASESSLLLSLEGAFTALLAWIVFRERAGGRVVAGMAVLAAGGALLSFQPQPGGLDLHWGALAVAGACLAWAIDNNLVKQIAGGDPIPIVAFKGLLSGGANIVLALGLGLRFPALPALLGILLAGYLTYGLCLVCMVRSMREIGAARMAAFFSTAPFVGVLLSVAALGERPGPLFLTAAALVAVGLFLFATEDRSER